MLNEIKNYSQYVSDMSLSMVSCLSLEFRFPMSASAVHYRHITQTTTKLKQATKTAIYKYKIILLTSYFIVKGMTPVSFILIMLFNEERISTQPYKQPSILTNEMNNSRSQNLLNIVHNRNILPLTLFWCTCVVLISYASLLQRTMTLRTLVCFLFILTIP